MEACAWDKIENSILPGLRFPEIYEARNLNLLDENFTDVCDL